MLLFHALRSNSLPLGILGTGVDLFFLISGFLMVAITDHRTRPWPFLKARLLRIVPLYWIFTSLALCLVLRQPAMLYRLVIGRHAQVPDISWHYAGASFAFMPWPSGPGQPLMPLIPAGWTLNLEMLFYALFALSLFLPRRHQLSAVTAMLVVLVGAGVLHAFGWPPLRGWTNPIVFEFLAGAWLGQAWQRGGPLWPRAWAICAVWVLLSLLGASGYGSPRSLLNAGLFVPYVVLFVAVLGVERRPGGIPKWKMASLLGDASYSIYLWQFFPIFAFQWLETRFGMPPYVFAAGVFATGLLGGVAVFLTIERPLMSLFGRNAQSGRGGAVPAGSRFMRKD